MHASLVNTYRPRGAQTIGIKTAFALDESLPDLESILKSERYKTAVIDRKTKNSKRGRGCSKKAPVV